MDFDEFFCWVVVPVIAVVGFLAVVILGARQLERHYGVKSCSEYGLSSGYETKFSDYHFWDWACLAKTENGKWVDARNLRGVNQ